MTDEASTERIDHARNLETERIGQIRALERRLKVATDALVDISNAEVFISEDDEGPARELVAKAREALRRLSAPEVAGWVRGENISGDRLETAEQQLVEAKRALEEYRKQLVEAKRYWAT